LPVCDRLNSVLECALHLKSKSSIDASFRSSLRHRCYPSQLAPDCKTVVATTLQLHDRKIGLPPLTTGCSDKRLFSCCICGLTPTNFHPSALVYASVGVISDRRNFRLLLTQHYHSPHHLQKLSHQIIGKCIEKSGLKAEDAVRRYHS